MLAHELRVDRRPTLSPDSRMATVMPASSFWNGGRKAAMLNLELASAEAAESDFVGLSPFSAEAVRLRRYGG